MTQIAKKQLQTKPYAFYFLLFCIIGWLYEVALAFHYGHGFVNRGFLFGPYLPLYGFGALLLIGCLQNLMKKPVCIGKISVTPLIVFVLVVLITTAVEYAASVILELLFHTRWWDYSTYAYQLHGRICLSASLRFGVGGIVFLYVLLPLFSRLFHKIPEKARPILSWAIIGILAVDFAVSCYIAATYGADPILAQPPH